MKKEALTELNSQLERKTGIDFTKYRDQNIFEALSDVLSFPGYFVRTLALSVLVYVLIIVLWAISQEAIGFKTFLFTIGIVLAFVNGILTGLRFIVKKIKGDIINIFTIVLNLVETITDDIDKVKSKYDSGELKVPTKLELFKGTFMIIVIPTLSDIVSNAIPLIGGIISRLVVKIITGIYNKLAKDYIPNEEAIGPEENNKETVASWASSVKSILANIHKHANKIINTATRIASLPVMIVSTIVLIISLIIIGTGYGILA